MKNESLNKRVAFFICNYVLGTSPSIINSALCLVRNGYCVDMFLYNVTDIDLVTFDDERINIYDLNAGVGGILVKASKKVLTRIFPMKFLVCIRRLLNDMAMSIERFFIKDKVYSFIPKHVINYVENIVSHGNYRCFIGVEPTGLIFASSVGSKLHIPIIYYSLELYLSYDNRFQSRRFKILKELEREYHKGVIATIIQDEERAKLLLKDNKVLSSKTILVPLSLLGELQQNKTRYLYEHLNVPSDKRIVLQIGAISADNFSLEIAEASQYLPSGWVLVMHGYADRDVVRKIRRLNLESKVYLSPRMVSFDKVPELVASADIGLVFYKNISDNELYIDSASGKLAHYLQCGLPIITIDLPGLKRVVKEYQCGVSISNPKDMATALGHVVSNYDKFRANAFRCYKDRYEFSHHFQKVIDVIENDFNNDIGL